MVHEKSTEAFLVNDRVCRWFNTKEMASNVANHDGVVGAFIQGYIMESRLANNARTYQIWFDAPISAESWYTEVQTSSYRTTFVERSRRVNETQHDDGDLGMDSEKGIIPPLSSSALTSDDEDEDAFYEQGQVLYFETGEGGNHVYGILPCEVKVKGNLGTCLMLNGAYNTYSTIVIGLAIARCKDPLYAKDCPTNSLNCLLRHRIRKPQQVLFEIYLLEAEYKIAHKKSNTKQLNPAGAPDDHVVDEDDATAKGGKCHVHVEDGSYGSNTNPAVSKVDVAVTSLESIAKVDGVANDMTADPMHAGEAQGAELGEAKVAPSAGPAPSTTSLQSTNVLGSQVTKVGSKSKTLSLLKKAVPPTVEGAEVGDGSVSEI